MQLFKSIQKNFNFILIHLSFWLVRFSILYLAFKPIKTSFEAFFKARTVKHDLLASSDIHALFEFFISGLDKNIATLFSGLLTAVFVFLIIDVVMDAGFIRSLYKKDKREFWSGVKGNFIPLFLLRIVLVLPLLFIAGLAFIAVLIFQATGMNPYLSLLAIFTLGIIALFFVRFSDTAKWLLIIKGFSVWESFGRAFSFIFKGFGQTLLTNVLTMFLFVVGMYCYFIIDWNLFATSSLLIFLSLFIQQCFILLKQILRYSYTDAVIMSLSLTEDEAVSEEEKPEQKGIETMEKEVTGKNEAQADDDFDVDDLFKEQ